MGYWSFSTEIWQPDGFFISCHGTKSIVDVETMLYEGDHIGFLHGSSETSIVYLQRRAILTLMSLNGALWGPLTCSPPLATTNILSFCSMVIHIYTDVLYYAQDIKMSLKMAFFWKHVFKRKPKKILPCKTTSLSFLHTVSSEHFWFWTVLLQSILC